MQLALNVSVIGIVGLAIFVIARKRKASDPSVTLQVIKTDISGGAALIDVRTPAEYKTEHAFSSVNVPFQDMQKGIFGSVRKDTKIYVYCRSGSRSAQAARLLQKAGYANIVDIHTLSSWKRLGGQVGRG